MDPSQDTFTNTNPPQTVPPSQGTTPAQTPVSLGIFSRFKSVPTKPLVFAGIGIVVVIIIFLVIRLFIKPQGSPTTILWWGLWEDQSVVTPLINAYESQHPKIKITYVNQSQQDYRERLTSAFAKKLGPDIFSFHNTWVPMFRGSLDSLPASVMNPSDYAKTFYPIASSDLTSGTSLVGIPLEYDALTLYINEDIFNKAGKPPPATWDDLRSVAKELTVKDDQGIITQSGVALGRTENVDHWPEILALMMLQNGVNLNNPVGKPAEDALKFFTVFSAIDGVWDATLPPSTQAFAAGKLAMYLGPSWRAFEIQQQNPNLKFKTVPVPQLPKDNPKQPDITYATYWVQGVWSGSAKKAAAWDFLKFLSTENSLQQLFTNESKLRSFGEPYPRPDMSDLLINHPLIGSIITQAPGAETWYLASRTFDGPTGINTLLTGYFADAVNSVADGKTSVDKALSTAAAGIAQVLAQYRLIAK